MAESSIRNHAARVLRLVAAGTPADQALRDGLALRGQQKAREFDYMQVSRNILSDLAFLTGAPAKIGQESGHAY